MAAYPEADLHARLAQISTDPTAPALLRRLAVNANARIDGYNIAPADLSDDAIKRALLVRRFPDHPQIDLGRLGDLLTHDEANRSLTGEPQ